MALFVFKATDRRSIDGSSRYDLIQIFPEGINPKDMGLWRRFYWVWGPDVIPADLVMFTARARTRKKTHALVKAKIPKQQLTNRVTTTRQADLSFLVKKDDGHPDN